LFCCEHTSIFAHILYSCRYSNSLDQFVSWLDANGDERLWGIDLNTSLTGATMQMNLIIHSKVTFIFSADAATSCDLFLFLSGGNVNMGDGRVMVEPPSDSLDPIAAPRHCVALDYLYATVSYSWTCC
jgi:hypothetical protein